MFLFVGMDVVVVTAAVVVIVSDGVEMIVSISTRDTSSIGEANAFNCLPRFRMVSWHSANFSEAAEISQSYTQVD